MSCVGITNDNFKSVVLGTSPVLLLCGTSTPSCDEMRNTLLSCIEQLRSSQNNHCTTTTATTNSDPSCVCLPYTDVGFVLAVLNVQNFMAVARQLEITTLPTTFAVYQLQFLDSIKGNLPRSEVESFLHKFIHYVVDNPIGDAKTAAECCDNTTSSSRSSWKMQKQQQQNSFSTKGKNSDTIARCCTTTHPAPPSPPQNTNTRPTTSMRSSKNKQYSTTTCPESCNNDVLGQLIGSDSSRNSTRNTSATTEGKLSSAVDVGKMLDAGRNALKKGQCAYAEKIFLKALGVLEAIQADKSAMEILTDNETNRVLQSSATCLAGLANCAVVKSEMDSAQLYIHKIQLNYGACVITSESEVAQAIALYEIVRLSGLQYPIGKTVDALRSFLRANPRSVIERAELGFLLFAEGSVQECLTECIKIAHLDDCWGNGYGRQAIDQLICTYLGPDHVISINARQIMMKVHPPHTLPSATKDESAEQ
jgi:thioredoxin-like negative regulator of GroEL